MGMYKDAKEFEDRYIGRRSEIPAPLDVEKIQDRVNRMLENLFELRAAELLDDQSAALVELVYSALVTAAMMGLPFKKLWCELHKANMVLGLEPPPKGLSADDVMKIGVMSNLFIKED
jgi:predicted HAD superfamily Cof-like phosphohydrolase